MQFGMLNSFLDFFFLFEFLCNELKASEVTKTSKNGSVMRSQFIKNLGILLNTGFQIANNILACPILEIKIYLHHTYDPPYHKSGIQQDIDFYVSFFL